MDDTKIMQLSKARKLKNSDLRADIEGGEIVLENINHILNRIQSVMRSANEHVSLTLLQAGLNPENFLLNPIDFEMQVANVIRFVAETGSDELNFQYEYQNTQADADAMYEVHVSAKSVPMDDEESEDGYVEYQECAVIVLTKCAENGVFYFSKDGVWERDQETEARMKILGEDNEDTARGRFAMELLDWKPDIGKKAFKRRLAETERLCKLFDSLPGLMYEEWMELGNGKLIPILSPMDEKRHGMFVSTENGKYCINAYMDSNNDSSYTTDIAGTCIFATDNMDEVTGYLGAILDHYTACEIWNCPISSEAALEIREGEAPSVRLASETQRELTEKELDNCAMIMEWYNDMLLQEFGDFEEDEEYEEDEDADDPE